MSQHFIPAPGDICTFRLCDGLPFEAPRLVLSSLSFNESSGVALTCAVSSCQLDGECDDEALARVLRIDSEDLRAMSLVARHAVRVGQVAPDAMHMVLSQVTDRMMRRLQ